ncbi:uncharacterized protein BKCO1_460006 [Diplodia corticola]|uniref:Uncharacterized protein n=1 Tax=Diplodia corticola TaxID=236234 RepID=A0A1J9QUF0_9PEZI|nr:uncharacterized protein BKCO1_460006 [Diplodia corticola]OJD31610.1 hypothetical protein BKCO1_460006 [Diplodia corticola]
MATEEETLTGSPSDMILADQQLHEESHPRKRQRTISFTDDLASEEPTKGVFPCFNDGDVIVTLKDSKRLHVWRLHSGTLAKGSAKIKKALTIEDDLAREVETPDGIKFHLTLAEPQQPPTMPLLVSRALNLIPEDAMTRVVSCRDRNSWAASPTPSGDNSVATQIKVEEQEGWDTSQCPGNLSARTQSEICSAYDNLFRHLYGLPLRLSTTVTVQHSLFRAEVLVSVFRAQGCLPSIRPHLGNVFSQYRRGLFEAIARDPCRWINLSIPLENESIYTEAYVHLVGSLSKYTKLDTRTIQPALMTKIKKKHENLMHAQEKVIGELLRLTIHVDGKPVTMGAQLETWIAVALFRDWLAIELDKTERRAPGTVRHRRETSSTSSTTSPLGIGSLLRRIHRGGDEYLEYDAVLKEAKEVYEVLGSDWEDLAEDLRTLKKFASKVVEKLCANNLMLDPELYGIPYLTCMDVGTKDLPWLAEKEGA